MKSVSIKIKKLDNFKFEYKDIFWIFLVFNTDKLYSETITDIITDKLVEEII